jgi:ABC-type Mn2+/Zn2+ transport system permease subunit
VDFLLEPFSYEFMQRALAEAALLGIVCGLLGALVVLRGLTFTGESMSHTLVPGAAVAIAVGFSVVAGALIAGVLAGATIALFLRRPDVGEDVAVSVVFTGAFAAGVIVISTRGSPKDLDSLLFGNILAVESRDLWLGLATAAVVVAVCAAVARSLVLVAFDRPFAEAAGLRPRALDLLLLVALAGALTVALRGVGTLLVLALLVAPAATARVLVERVWSMLWLAPVLAVAAAIVGLEISFHGDVAAGPAIALSSIAGFGLALAARSARRAVGRRAGQPIRSGA